MKKSMFTASLAGGLLLIASTTSFSAESYRDWARVTDVEPVYETVRTSYPEERCRERYHPSDYGKRHHNANAPVVLGAIVGGVVGNQFGKGRGKDAATVAGALLGGALAHDATRSSGRIEPVRHRKHCKIVDRYDERREIVGYDVTYRYKKQTFHTHTRKHPGDRIAIRVTVEPERGGRHHYR